MKGGRLLENLAAADVSSAQLERMYLDHMRDGSAATRRCTHDRHDRQQGATVLRRDGRVLAVLGLIAALALLALAHRLGDSRQARGAGARGAGGRQRGVSAAGKQAFAFGRAFRPHGVQAAGCARRLRSRRRAVSRPGDLARSAPAGSSDVPPGRGCARAPPARRSQCRRRSDESAAAARLRHGLLAPSQESASAERCARS